MRKVFCLFVWEGREREGRSSIFFQPRQNIPIIPSGESFGYSVSFVVFDKERKRTGPGTNKKIKRTDICFPVTPRPPGSNFMNTTSDRISGWRNFSCSSWACLFSLSRLHGEGYNTKRSINMISICLHTIRIYCCDMLPLNPLRSDVISVIGNGIGISSAPTMRNGLQSIVLRAQRLGCNAPDPQAIWGPHG